MLTPAAGPAWDGIALRRARGRADPDSPGRAVLLPATWPATETGDDAADALAALAALAPGAGPASLPRLAGRWLGRVGAAATRLGLPDAPALVPALRDLLLRRRGAPGLAAWTGAEGPHRFVLNLPAFLEAEGFDAPGYADAVRLAVLALEALGEGRATRLRLGFADLAGWLAGLDLDYDSDAARDAAAALGALTRGAAEAASGAVAEALGAREPVRLLWPAPPEICAVPGLADAARAALDDAAAAPGLRHAALFALSPADAVEALLGAESGGLAPAVGPTRWVEGADGAPLERPTAAALRAGPRAAALLAPRRPSARAAMESVLRPWLHAAAPLPALAPAPARPAVRAISPDRSPDGLAAAAAPRAAGRATGRAARGRVWKVAVAGHRVTLRTTEAPDGALAEVTLSLSKEGAAVRAALDALCASVSLGLAGGVALEEYVRAFAYARLGPGGTVEGDPDIALATSSLDWAFRRLALDHLPDAPALPDPSEQECDPDGLGTPAQQQPLLPLDAAPAPRRPRRRDLRLVG